MSLTTYSSEFILSLKAHDEQSFAKLYEDTIDVFYRYLKAHYSLEEDTIQDICSQTYLKLWNNIDKIKDGQQIHSYIRTILKHTTYDFFKKQKEVSFSQLDYDNKDGSFEEWLEDNQTIQDLFEQTFQSDRIYVAMQKLDEMYKDVIFCKYIQEYSHKEIAEYLQISEENVRQRLSRWLAKLKKLLSDE